jgi:hypothetical protein
MEIAWAIALQAGMGLGFVFGADHASFNAIETRPTAQR